MKRRIKIALFLSVPLVILVALFLLVDFRLLQGQLTADSEVETFSFGAGEETVQPLAQDIDLYLQVSRELEDELGPALAEELRANNSYARNVRLQEGPLQPAQDAVLVVDIEQDSDLFWSPFLTQSEITARVAYASDGAVAWIDEEVVRLKSSDSTAPVVRVRAEHQFSGRAYGLISNPGYRHYLADKLAAQINASLVKTLNDHGGFS